MIIKAFNKAAKMKKSSPKGSGFIVERLPSVRINTFQRKANCISKLI
jgi:hypothetical protein